MTERAPVGNPPIKSVLASREGTPALAWLTWFNALTVWAQRVRVFQFAIDVPSIPGGARWDQDFTIANTMPGDFAAAALAPTNGGLIVTAQVRATNTVRVTAQNQTGGAIDPAAGVIFIRVERAR